MLAAELFLSEDASWPLWASLVKKSLERGKPMYFASGGSRIVDIEHTRTFDKTMFVLHLEHTTRKEQGKPKKQTYTIWNRTYDLWTLEKFKDGYRMKIKMKIDTEDSTKAFESVEEPLVVSIFRKLVDMGEPVFHVNRSGRYKRLKLVDNGVSVSGQPAWWFYETEQGARNGDAIVWRVGDNVNNLTISNVPTKSDPQLSHWVLHDKKVKVNEGVDGDAPMLVRLINQRIAKKGAVKLELTRVNPHITGWITEPIVRQSMRDGHVWRALYFRRTSEPNKIFYFNPNADSSYTLKKEKDLNGNTVIKVVYRDTE